MAYSRTTWQNSPSTATPISAELLNNMEQGIVDIDGAISSISSSVTSIAGSVSNTAGSVVALAGTAGTAYNLTSTYGSVVSTQGSVNSTQGSVANTQGSVSSHLSATASVHGITNTANLVYTDNATLGSVAGINASLGSALGTISTNTSAIGSVAGTVAGLVTQSFGTINSTMTIETAQVGKLNRITSSTAINILLPPTVTSPIPVGSIINFMQMGSGTVNFIAGPGADRYAEGNKYQMKGQYSIVSALKTEDNAWVLFGNLT